jgi:hypothetical protein
MLNKQEEGGTKYCLFGRDGGQKIFITSAANQTSMYRSCNPPKTVTVPTAFCFACYKPAPVFLTETLQTFLALLYRHFRDKNSATVAALRWFRDATSLEDTARTLVTKILDKPRYTSRRECGAHFNAY